MICRLCSGRKTRRACPALGHDICAVCCGTKRLVEIACPADCVYLAGAREHPPAIAVRQRQRDLALLLKSIRDLNERQSRLFLIVATFLARHVPQDLQRFIDEDAGEAVAALASTLETAARGVIYEHQPTSLPAARLLGALKPILVKASGSGGTAADRDAALVLRRLEEAVRAARAWEPENQRAFFEWLARFTERAEMHTDPTPGQSEAPRLILP